ncbi:MAG: galactose-1-epimerase, partial [Oscillochloris sp.]|nr:galactose-1-epimerase [Oscillochloris sp.]
YLEGIVRDLDRDLVILEEFADYHERQTADGIMGYRALRSEPDVKDKEGVAQALSRLMSRRTLRLSHPTYANLVGSGNILGHMLEIPAAHVVAVDSSLIPTGELRSVAGTPLDFRTSTAIGARINNDDEQLRYAGGYDHTWVIDKTPDELGLAARLSDPDSGRVLEVLTTEPGIQFYAGNMMEGGLVGRGDQHYMPHSGLCLEAQHFPDSPNQPGFPSTTLLPGATYRQTTIYRLKL